MYNNKLIGPYVLIIILLATACNTESAVERSYPEDTSTIKVLQSISPQSSGINFSNNITETQSHNLVSFEGYSQGAGVAILDYDNDGYQDIFFSSNMEGDRLYRNKGDMTFEDVTRSAGIRPQNWSTGAVVVDINNDGYDDIYVCKFLYDEPARRQNMFYINNGKGQFVDKAKEMGLNDSGYSITANFLDYDNDGDLDMYLANQPPNSLAAKRPLKNKINYAYTDRLFRNDNGKFSDVTQQSGITNYNYTLSISALDYNKDGLTDIYIACDYEEPDKLYKNNGNGTFTDVALDALKHIGNFSMGADIADIDNDGNTDIYVVDMVAEDNFRQKTNMSSMNPEKFFKLANNGFHYQYMYNSLQLNNDDGSFSEIAQMAGVSNTDWSWSPLFIDLDNDSYKDLIVTNGLIKDIRNKDYENWRKKFLQDKMKEAEQTANKRLQVDPMEISNKAKSVKISNYVYSNNGDLTFKKQNAKWGIDNKTWSHGSAYADFDNDGDLDIIINNMGQPADLYQNMSNENGLFNYITIKLVGDKSNRKGINSKIILKYGNGEQQVTEYTPYRGYMSTSQCIAHFGLGKNEIIDQITVQWNDGTQTTMSDVAVNQELTIEKANTQPTMMNRKNNRLFKSVDAINYVHTENEYDDYAEEILLPYRPSTLGPIMATADVNNDGQMDVYIGGSAGVPGQLLMNNGNARLSVSPDLFAKDARYEDGGALFFDSDGDGDLDLYVASGGNDFPNNSKKYKDRLYINDGDGGFRYVNALPAITVSTAAVCDLDYDGDGDLDLFVGGRQVPGAYGRTPKSFLFENRNGKFIDVTEDKAKFLRELGMVTTAKNVDINGDGTKELVVAGEWMHIMVLQYSPEGITDVTDQMKLPKMNGWWNTIEVADVDGDGDQDIVAGNLGLNIKYKATEDEPFKMYVDDFDDNGTNDVYLGYYENGQCYPVRGKQCSSQQMPFVSKKFETYNDFGLATIDKVLEDHISETTLVLSVQTFENSVFQNNGSSFTQIPMPNRAQIAPIYGIAVDDFNSDGKTDVFVAGNMYQREVETTRSDGGKGYLMTMDTDRKFDIQSTDRTGISADKDVRSVALLKGKSKNLLVIANNDDALQTYEYE
jgi:hypothetical protein